MFEHVFEIQTGLKSLKISSDFSSIFGLCLTLPHQLPEIVDQSQFGYLDFQAFLEVFDFGGRIKMSETFYIFFELISGNLTQNQIFIMKKQRVFVRYLLFEIL